jgi:hypothetical protein
MRAQEDIQKCIRKRDYPFDDGRVAKYGQPKERTNETLDCASEAKIWKVSYQPRWARDISVLCASLRMSGVQALLLVVHVDR